MKHLTILLVMLLCLPSLAQNSNRQERLEEIRTFRIAFYSDKLELTPTEAEQFWPVFNEFNKKKRSIHYDIKKQFRQHDKSVGEGNTPDAKQCETLAKLFVEAKLQEAKLQEQYHEKFQSILTPQKLVRLYQIEEHFNHELLKKIRSNHHKSPPR